MAGKRDYYISKLSADNVNFELVCKTDFEVASSDASGY